MALALYDRVAQTGTANTTVSFTLSGSVQGFQAFTIIGNGNTTFYGATDTTGNWEVGIGTYSTTGPTLTRTTILASSNSGSAVTFSGTVTVFVTYPSEKSVNLDGSGNVSALGTIASGVWQGTTVGVAYGGTGVTSSSGANSVVLRDSNSNITANNILLGFTSTVTAAGTTTLTSASTQYQRFTGTTTQTVKLPDATTLQKGFIFIVNNGSTGTLTVVDNASTTLDVVIGGAIDYWTLLDNSTSAGTWIAYSLIPASYDFNNTSASFGNATIINAVWNGTTIASGYGGTGLTTFAAANNALYSTSSSTLTAGTLPVAAGGTGITSLTANYIPYGNGTGALNSSANFTYNGTILNLTGTAARFQGDFSNATVNSRTAFQTSTTNSATGIYAVPNGTGTAASWQASNAADPTNASKILIATNGSTDVQLVSGINGTGTYLPMGFWNNGAEKARLSVSGGFSVGTTTDAGSTNILAAGTVTGAGVISSAGIVENSATISANYTIGTGNNAMSTGPITVSSGVTVTVPSGSNWVIL